MPWPRPSADGPTHARHRQYDRTRDRAESESDGTIHRWSVAPFGRRINPGRQVLVHPGLTRIGRIIGVESGGLDWRPRPAALQAGGTMNNLASAKRARLGRQMRRFQDLFQNTSTDSDNRA